MHQGPSWLHRQTGTQGGFWGVLDFHSPTPAAPNRVQLPSEPEDLLSSPLSFPQVQSFQHSTHMTQVLNHAQTHLCSQHFGFKPMKLFTTSYGCYSNILLSFNINCLFQNPIYWKELCSRGKRHLGFPFPIAPSSR